MLKLNRILVPIDDTALADKALDTALSLAETFRAHLYVLYVRISRDDAANDTADEEALDAQTEGLRLSVSARLREGHSLSADFIHPEIRTGSALSCIVDASVEHGIDLIVMGTHGRHGLLDLFTGSTTERVLQRVKAAMYVVREDEKVG